jgi:hypothetical protein
MCENLTVKLDFDVEYSLRDPRLLKLALLVIPHRGGEIELLLLPFRGDSLNAGLGQRPATIDAVGVGLRRG